MKTNILIFVLLISSFFGFSQDTYLTKNGKIEFNSKTPVENIEAVNQQVTSFFKTETGEIQFGVLIKSFKFKNALMEEHFNENYIESDKFPKAKFMGKIDNYKEINFKKAGTYNAKISGDITIHGVTKKIELPSVFIVENNGITGKANIELIPQDFNISIPDLVKEKIAKTISVDIVMNYELYNK